MGDNAAKYPYCVTAGKVWTARIAAATPEQQVAWHTMHVIIDSFGIISKARSDPALFGVKAEELMGQSVAFCIDLFRAMIETGGNMAENIKNFLAEAKTSRQQVWRVGICPKGRRTVPGLMKVCFSNLSQKIRLHLYITLLACVCHVI